MQTNIYMRNEQFKPMLDVFKQMNKNIEKMANSCEEACKMMKKMNDAYEFMYDKLDVPYGEVKEVVDGD